MATAADDINAAPNGAGKRVLVRGTLYSPHGAHSVWIKDISSSGAVVSSQDRLPGGCDVALKRGTTFVAGRVTSAGENRAEIKFYRDLNPGEISSATNVATG